MLGALAAKCYVAIAVHDMKCTIEAHGRWLYKSRADNTIRYPLMNEHAALAALHHSQVTIQVQPRPVPHTLWLEGQGIPTDQQQPSFLSFRHNFSAWSMLIPRSGVRVHQPAGCTGALRSASSTSCTISSV